MAYNVDYTHEAEVTPEMKMWKAVLDQAIHDAMPKYVHAKYWREYKDGRPKELIKEKCFFQHDTKAYNYIMEDNELTNGFRNLCDVTHTDHIRIRNQIKKLCENPQKYLGKPKSRVVNIVMERI